MGCGAEPRENFEPFYGIYERFLRENHDVPHTDRTFSVRRIDRARAPAVYPTRTAPRFLGPARRAAPILRRHAFRHAFLRAPPPQKDLLRRKAPSCQPAQRKKFLSIAQEAQFARENARWQLT